MAMSTRTEAKSARLSQTAISTPEAAGLARLNPMETFTLVEAKLARLNPTETFTKTAAGGARPTAVAQPPKLPAGSLPYSTFLTAATSRPSPQNQKEPHLTQEKNFSQTSSQPITWI